MVVGMMAFALTLAVATSPAVPPPRWRPAPRETSSREVVEAEALGLRKKGRGYQRVRNPGDRFDALVLPDGQVEFTLDREVAVKVDGVCGFAVCIGGRAEEERPRPAAKRARTLGMVAALVGEAALTGNVRVGGWGYGTPRRGPIPGSELGSSPPQISERLVNVVGRYGHLPAPVAEMSAFMDETLEFRTALARKDAERKFEEAHRDLKRTLAGIWKSERSPERKRAAVLSVWADIDVPASARDVPLSASLDEQRATAGVAAREALLASVRANVPEGSSGAFTQAELAAFNADAPVVFCPYGEAGCPQPPLEVAKSPSPQTE